jgi:alanine or glycine:cation symporter, AGCS family
MTKNRKLALLVLVLLLSPGPMAAWQAAAADPPETSAAQEMALEEQAAPVEEEEAEQGPWDVAQAMVDQTFGVLLNWASYLPFFNLASLVGADEPRVERDAEGRPVLGPDGEPVPLVGPDGNAVILTMPFVVAWLIVAGVFFTLKMRFVNFRLFRHAIQVVRGKFDHPGDAGEVSHFAALSSALSATVGLGNIAGVAIAVSLGGPGATFWMIIAGLLGMTLKFTECTLGQRYRHIDEHGRVSGGPMRYLKDGLAKRNMVGLGIVLSVVFSVFAIGGSLAGGNAFQVSQSLGILQERMPFFVDNGWVYGVAMALFAGVVIVGGIRRIAHVAEAIVPFMCGLYVLACMTIIIAELDRLPMAFGLIFRDAFSGEAIYGGALGALFMGFRRAAFSNEAGVGSASIAHSAARTEYPVREGIVALLEPFIDTVVVCTMTSLVIVFTGVYNAPAHADLVQRNLGAALTSAAFQDVSFLAGWFPWVLMVAVVLFAFSTMISWSYYGERCWTYLFGDRSSMLFKLLFLAFVVLGSIIRAPNVLLFGDLMILLMAFPNIVGLYILGGEVKGELKVYQERLARGGFPIFGKTASEAASPPPAAMA